MLVDDPTDYKVWTPDRCRAGGLSLEAAAVVGHERRQVVDLPEPRLEIVEHQALRKVCAHCQTVTTETFPADVTQPVQYRARVKATAVYLQIGQFLSYERTVATLRDLFGVKLSEGTLTATQATAYTQLGLVETTIVAMLRQQPVVMVDACTCGAGTGETGARVPRRCTGSTCSAPRR